VPLSHHDRRCTLETILVRYDLRADPALEQMAHLIHQADLNDDLFDAPAATGLDIRIRGLTLSSDHDRGTLIITHRLFDGLYAHIRRDLLTPRPPT